MAAEHWSLNNRTCHLPEHDWERYEDCPPVTKDVLDDQQVDESVLRLRDECNESNSMLPVFQPDLHITLHYVKAYYSGPVEDPNYAATAAQLRGQATRVSERQQIVQWRGEHFKCRVGFSIESCIPKSNWTMGLAQACEHILLENKFEQGGSYKWEFQQLKTGLHTMVNDSNGSQWPFYSHNSAMIDIQSGVRIRPNFYELKFSDYFYPTMHWTVQSGGREFFLTHINRQQHFKIWLILIKRGANHPKDGVYTRYMQFRPDIDEIIALKCMQWRFNIELNFDCTRPLGSRCVSINDTQEEQPSVLDTVEPIPTSAITPPNCNACQSLIFYPTNHGHPLVLKKPPEETVVPWPEWRKSMTAGLGYERLEGFQNPVSSPVLFPCFPGDPHLPIQTLSVRLQPM